MHPNNLHYSQHSVLVSKLYALSTHNYFMFHGCCGHDCDGSVSKNNWVFFCVIKYICVNGEGLGGKIAKSERAWRLRDTTVVQDEVHPQDDNTHNS